MSPEQKLDAIYRAGRNAVFNRSVSEIFVGGRSRLDTLMKKNEIRFKKTGELRFSPYEINAEDVLRHAVVPESQQV